jgi:hypothetical protein
MLPAKANRRTGNRESKKWLRLEAETTTERWCGTKRNSRACKKCRALRNPAFNAAGKCSLKNARQKFTMTVHFCPSLAAQVP